MLYFKLRSSLRKEQIAWVVQFRIHQFSSFPQIFAGVNGFSTRGTNTKLKVYVGLFLTGVEMLKTAKCFYILLRVPNMSGGSSQSKSLINVIQVWWILWITYCSGVRNFSLLWGYRSSASVCVSMVTFYIPSYCPCLTIILYITSHVTFLSV